MNYQRRRNVFKMRKSKVYKNLVSFGKYGVLTGITLSTLGVNPSVFAEESSAITTTATVSSSIDENAASETNTSATQSQETESTPTTEIAYPRAMATAFVDDEVGGSLTSVTPLTNNREANAAVTQTASLSISGEQANYDGSYIEVVIEDGTITKVIPSQLNGVTITQRTEGNKTILKYTFADGALRGGAYYNLSFTYNLAGTNAWSNVSQSLSTNDFNVTTTATLYDADGNALKELGSNKHNFIENYNAAGGGTRMTHGQVVGYDLDKDGKVDAGGGQLAYYVYTGAFRNNNPTLDHYATGPNVFDGRMINGWGYGDTGGTIIAPVTSYTYDVPLKAGTTLSQESKDLGWYEDANGYHLTVTRDTNPLDGDNTSTTATHNAYVPLVLDVVEGANVSDLTSSRSLSVTGTYTKEDGSTYTNTANIPYYVTVPTAESSQGLISLNHAYSSDTNIIKPHGQTHYNTLVSLSNAAPMNTAYSLDNYAVTVTTNNDNEFFQTISYDNDRNLHNFLKQGGTVKVYNDETGDLLTTLDKDSPFTTTLDTSSKIKTLRYEFSNISLIKDTSRVALNELLIREMTFFDDWETIYKDSSITQLISSTTATLINNGTPGSSASATGILDRVVQTVEMVDNPSTIVTDRHNYGGGITQSYRGAATYERQLVPLVDELHVAYLVDSNLKINNSEDLFDIQYNYNGTGKDLYVFKNPAPTDRDRQVLLQIANEYVPNGEYEVLTFSFWKDVDPSLKPIDGIDFGTVNGIDVTTENSTSRVTKLTLAASEKSGVLSRVKADDANNYALNTSGHEAQDVVDFEISFKNVAPNILNEVSVITSLPRTGDTQLDARGNARNSEFSVYLTQPVTPPEGWMAVYSTGTGTANQLNAGTWLTADEVTDWSTITAIKFVSTQPVPGGSKTDFYINDAVIGTDALQGEKAYLSSASSAGSSSAFVESNNVLIQMANEIADGTVRVQYVDEDGNVIAEDKTVENDIKSAYDVSDKDTYYPEFITGTNGLEYEYVKTDESSANNTGTFTSEEKVIKHVYKVVNQTATIKYVDITDTDNPVQLGDIDSRTGKSADPIDYSTTDRINDYLKQGYEVVSNSFGDSQNYDTDRSVDQAFVVELKQRIVAVPEGSNPGQPVNPDDPNSPVWPDSIESLVTSKTVTRTIEYKYIDKNGKEASKTVTQTVTFTRSAEVNLVTGETTYGDWTTNNDTFPVVDSPTISGYTADKTTADALTVTPDDEDSNVVVIYTPNNQKASITYVDDNTGETITVDNINGDSESPMNYSTAEKIKELEEKGYVLVSDDFPSEATYDSDDNTDQAFRVVLKHATQTVDPENPVNPKTNEPLELSKTITRTIEYVYEDGTTASQSVTQTVTFTRTATVDMVTGEVTYSDWSATTQTVDGVTSPIINGYTASGNVDSKDVLVTDSDWTETIVYKKNPVQPSNNQQPANSKPEAEKSQMLPKTGQSDLNTLGIGAALASIGLLAAFKRKKENSEDDNI